MTAVYRVELATRLKTLGYEIDRGASGQPEIRGYTQEYLDASSPRRHQIQDRLAKTHHRGAEAAEIAAHQTREPKRDHSQADMQRRHQQMAEAFGDQPAQAVRAAHVRAHDLEAQAPGVTAHAAVTFAKKNDGPLGHPCRSGTGGLPRRTVRADVPCGANARRSRDSVERLAAASGADRRSV